MFELRKTLITLETILHEGGPIAESPLICGGIGAVVKNPYAGQFATAEELQKGMQALKPLGLQITEQLLAAMNCSATDIQAYGKGAIVGEQGELEHAALWHVPGGYAMREILGEAKAIVPSAVKVAGMGASLDIPLHHINAAYVRDHFSALELSITDAPRADEIVFCLAMANGGRIHARMGGLQTSDIKGEDGLR